MTLHTHTHTDTAFYSLGLNVDFDDKIHCFQIKIECSLKSFHQVRDFKMTMSYYYAIKTIEFGI